jgi:transcriptional regulator with XRE-family HTH domain
MTQQQLAQAVGIRFQQVQKYESGANRVSASRLWDLARALNAPVTFFFDGLDAKDVNPSAKSFAGAVEDKDTHDMLRAYLGLSDGPRRRLLDLAMAMNEMSAPQD